MKIFDKASFELILQHGISKGYWTMEQLDIPPATYEQQILEARKSHYFGEHFCPPQPYVNQLRKTTTVEVVTADPAHDDLASAASPNEGQPNLDLLPQQWPPVPGERDLPDLCRHQNARADSPDHGHQRHMGTTRQPPAPDHGGNGQSALESQSAPDPDPIPW